MASVSQWTPFGVALDLTATGSGVTRKSATTFSVNISASWETHWDGAQTNYGMEVTSGGVTKTISSFGTKRSSGSGSFTGTYSISGNGSQTKTITVTFINYEENSSGNVTESASRSVTFNVAVPAWTSYTVKYSANGGSGAPSTQTKWKDQTLTLSSTKPTRSGWTFMGWGTSASDTIVDYAAGGKYTANAVITLYAIWRKALTLTYDGNVSYTTIKVPSASTAYIYNATSSYKFTISSNRPTRTNYTFLGWSTSKTATTPTYGVGDTITISANTTLYAVWKVSYVYPKIGKISVARTSSVMVDGVSKTSANVSFSWETFNENPTVTIECLDNVGQIINELMYTTALSGTSGTFSNAIGNNSLILYNTYTIRVTIDDGDGNASNTALVPAMTYPIHFKPGGKGTAVGKPAEFDNTFDVAWLTRIRDHLCVGEKTGYHDGKTGVFVSNEGFIHLQRSTAQGYNTYIGFYKDSDTSASAQLLYRPADDSLRLLGANDVYLEARGVTYRPYYTKGDVITVGIATSGYVTNSKKNISFTVPLSKPVLNVSSVTAAAVNGLTIRQNGEYTHGSSASAGTTSCTYSASTQGGGNHIQVTATMSDTTNAVNNTPAGIYWSGTITFA